MSNTVAKQYAKFIIRIEYEIFLQSSKTYGSKVYDTCLTISSSCCESQGNGYMASTT
jgi:hypothetical protein